MNESASFVLHRRAELDARDVESSDRAVTEVVCCWGEQTVLVRHLRGGERFTVSCDPEDRSADLFVSHEDIGADSKSWVCIQERGMRWLVTAPPAAGCETFELDLASGEAVVFTVGAIAVRVRRVRSAKAAARSRRSDRVLTGALVASFTALAALVGAGKIVHASRSPLLAVGDEGEREAYIVAAIARQNRAASSASGEGSAGSSGHRDESAPGANQHAPRSGSARVGRARGRARSDAHRPTQPRELIASRGIFASLAGMRDASLSPFDGVGELGARALGVAGLSARDGDGGIDGFEGLGGGVRSMGSLDGGGWCGCGGTIGLETHGFALSSEGHGMRVERAIRAADAPLRERIVRGPRVCGVDPTDPRSRNHCAPNVTGGLSAEIVRRVVRRNIGQMQRCFELALQRGAATDGRVVTRFIISSNGSVLGSMVESNDTGDLSLGACVNQAFRRLEFAPSPEGGVSTVSYPITFASE